MNALVKTTNPAYPAFQMSEPELINVLRNSLYPGAQDDSIKMVVGYCRASNLDPMQKPVHIVPIWDSKASTMRDVVMPGIGLYRSQASRSGEYAGVTEPEFGEDVTENIGGTTITYPKWCRVTVKRLLPNGLIVEFTAKELWKENYAQKGGKDKSIAPNAMWFRRPYAQLAKCSEAQALRKAFPEFGSQPTADEMEGKEIDVTPQSGNEPAYKGAPEPIYFTDSEFDEKTESWMKTYFKGVKAGNSADQFYYWIESKGKRLTDSQKEIISQWKEPQTIEGQATQVDDPFVSEMNAAEQQK